MKNKRFLNLTLILCGVILIAITSFVVFDNYSTTPEEPTTEVIPMVDEIPTPTDSFDGLVTTNDNIKIPVLCYHSISEDTSVKSPTVISTELFREHLQALSDNGYTTLTMEQLTDYLQNNKPVPEKSVIITFDDGYYNNYSLAFPILKEFNMKATIFLIADFLNTDNFMTYDNVKEMLDYGIDMQGHTFSHQELATLTYDEQLKELTDSKKVIEELTGQPVYSIAYPYGSYNEDSIQAAKDAGYKLAFTVKKGYAEREDNPYEYNRILIDYTYGAKDILKNVKK